MDVTGSRLLYVRDRYLRVHELHSGRDNPLVSLRRPGQSQGASLGQGPRALQYNTFNNAESNVLVSTATALMHLRHELRRIERKGGMRWH